MAFVIKIVNIPNGRAGRKGTPFDGQYLVEYDPFRRERNIIEAHLVTSPNLDQAKRFASDADATAYAKVSRGVRPWDGRPDRPLTAFTVTIDDELAFAMEEIGVPVVNRLGTLVAYFADDKRKE